MSYSAVIQSGNGTNTATPGTQAVPAGAAVGVPIGISVTQSGGANDALFFRVKPPEAGIFATQAALIGSGATVVNFFTPLRGGPCTIQIGANSVGNASLMSLPLFAGGSPVPPGSVTVGSGPTPWPSPSQAALAAHTFYGVVNEGSSGQSNFRAMTGVDQGVQPQGTYETITFP